MNSVDSRTCRYTAASPGVVLLRMCVPLLAFAALAAPAMPVNPKAEEDAKYVCPTVEGEAQGRKIASELSSKTTEKNSLACAADILAQLSKAAPSNLPLRIDALESLANYIDNVLLLKRLDGLQSNWAEYQIRLEHAKSLSSELISSGVQEWPKDPSIAILKARIDGSLAGPSESLTIVAAIAELKRAIAISPTALHGEGQLVIAQDYMELPPLFGGGAGEALPYLEQARKIAPSNPRPIRIMAEAYDELDRRPDALRALHDLLQVPVVANDLQLSADEWRLGEGLASRIGDQALAEQLAKRRAQLMSEHPGLLSRKSVAAWGHGGDNPLTGDPQYIGENKTAIQKK